MVTDGASSGFRVLANLVKPQRSSAQVRGAGFRSAKVWLWASLYKYGSEQMPLLLYYSQPRVMGHLLEGAWR